ncbi:beta strand repeat-containing protein [Prosthecobacter sp.]|uniref:beta strand repeat-containing protein n=1 Tax=Prosthecobacter sp. TaxID=1965333 RepID=UPI003782E2E1
MKIQHRNLTAAVLAAACIFSAASLQAATFVISSNSTTAQTLGSGSGQTGTVNSGVSLTVSGSTVAVTVTGNNATITNNGTISQTGTGRTIDLNTASVAMAITNNAGALIQSADSDTIRGNKASDSVTVDNYGSIISLNASAGGSQALDLAAITSGATTIRNYSTGLIKATAADAMRPGASGTVNNSGSIQALPIVDASITADREATGSDGIDAQTNSGVQITNNNGGSISGRHGITGGAASDALNSFSITVTNNVGGTITGINGSGINIDNFSSAAASSSANVTNYGTIAGNFDSAHYDVGDGDGVDVDGITTLNNYGIIRGLSANGTGSDGQTNHPEGVSIGGGTINNYSGAEITGGALDGMGIEGHGILVDNSSSGNAFAATTINNSGLIRGTTGYAIKMIGTFDNSVTNNAGGIIRGAGDAITVGAAIQTGSGNDTLSNAGTITGDNGKAIDLQAGNDTLTITGGTITGDIDGGTGTNTATISPGAGNTFSYAGSISNFSSVDISTGNVILSGSSTYTGNTTVNGTLSVTNVTGSATGSGSVVVNSGGTLKGTGTVGSVSLASGGVLAPGVTVGTLNINGTLDITSGSHFAFDLGSTSDLLNISGALNYTGGGSAIFDIADTGGMTYGGDYTLLNYGSASGLTLSNLSFGSTPAGFSGEFTIGANSLTLHVDAAPEPSRALLGMLGLAFVGLRRRRGGRVEA